MTDLNAKIFEPRVSDLVGDIRDIGCDTKFKEILIVGDEGIACLTASGKIISKRRLPRRMEIIGRQRTPKGWRVLVLDNLELSILSIPDDSSPEVLLSGTVTNALTARWNPDGHLVAIGSEGTELFVYNSQNGQMQWKGSVVWDTDELITPPKLSVQGWTQDGKCIITTAEYLAALTCNIWDAYTGKLLTFID